MVPLHRGETDQISIETPPLASQQKLVTRSLVQGNRKHVKNTFQMGLCNLLTKVLIWVWVPLFSKSLYVFPRKSWINEPLMEWYVDHIIPLRVRCSYLTRVKILVSKASKQSLTPWRILLEGGYMQLPCYLMKCTDGELSHSTTIY